MRAAYRRPLWLVATGALVASLVATTPAQAGAAGTAGAAGAAPAGAAPAGATPADVAVPRQASGPAYRAPHPVDPSVDTFPVSGVSPAGLRALAPGARAKTGRAARPGTELAALSAPEPASGFAVTGVTWHGRAPAGLKIYVRTRTGATWSGWTAMGYDPDHGPDPTSAEGRHARPGTDAFVVGKVDDVQLKAVSPTGRAPRGLTLSVVNPGHSRSDASPAPITPDEAAEIAPPPVTKSSVTSLQAQTTPVSGPRATPMPTIYSRADWGADERMRSCCVEYGEVHAGFVHHTVNANGYSRAEVPAIIRGIYAYHTQSRGWRDIGYNYLIDRFGRIWEGRYGGITLPVIGAHTLNYNENAFAASAIGNYDTAHPSAAMIDAYARLYAWKLSLHGIRPTSRQKINGTWLNAINGHRDVEQTACPGRYLYAKIPTIIQKAAQYQHSFTGRDMQHSFVHNATPDLLLVGSRGGVSVARGTGAPGFGTPSVTSSTFAGTDWVVPVGDVTGDHLGDLMARDTATGTTSVYPGLGTGTFGAAVDPTRRWSGADLFSGAGDVTGDGRNDVVARSASTGQLLVYPGRGDGTFGRAVVAMSDATGINLVTAAGDFDQDGHGDLVTRGIHGALFLWSGDGTGLFPTHHRLALDWSGKDSITGGVDVTGDGRPDLVARSSSTDDVSAFANIGGSTLSPAVGHLITTARRLSISPDVTGDGRADLVALASKSRLTVYAGSGRNWLGAPVRSTSTWRGMDKVMVVGDWDGDGYVDAMARRASDGTLWLYRGTSSGTFEPGVGKWAGWGSRRRITPVGDVNGDGRPDLMAQSRTGAMYLYPGRRLKGFGRPVRMRSSLPSGATIIDVGLWNRDGAPDVLVRTRAGALLLYAGNGPGGLEDPKVIGRNFDSYDSLVGVGDLTGDGQADLVGRTRNGYAWLIPGVAVSSKTPRGSFGTRQFLAAGLSGYRLG